MIAYVIYISLNSSIVVEIFGDQVNVLGIGARGNNRNMETFQKLMNEMYDLNLQY